MRRERWGRCEIALLRVAAWVCVVGTGGATFACGDLVRPRARGPAPRYGDFVVGITDVIIPPEVRGGDSVTVRFQCGSSGAPRRDGSGSEWRSRTERRTTG